MKRFKCFLSLVLCLVMLISSVPLSAFAVDGNTKSFEGYIPISTKADLNAIRNDLSAKYYLTNNIVFSESDFSEGGNYYNDGAGWSPIGTYDEPFVGTLDGNGYAIKNLKISINSSSTVMAGLFGFIEGNIVNLGMDNCSLSVRVGSDSDHSSNVYVGGFVARSDSYDSGFQIDSCYFSGNISVVFERGSTYDQNKLYVGGIIGQDYAEIEIKNCINYGNIEVQATDCNVNDVYLGGIMGYGNSTLLECSNIGELNAYAESNSYYGDAYTYVGGIAGNLRGDAKGCTNIGVVKATSKTADNSYICEAYSYAGGIAAYAVFSTITDSSNLGVVKAVSYPGDNGYSDEANAYAGGISGCGRNVNHIQGQIIGSNNSGKIIASVESNYNGEAYVGGISGYDSIITNCYNVGEVASTTVNAESFTGGISGKDGHISCCYNSGDVKTNLSGSGWVQGSYIGAPAIGGIIGLETCDDITNCFNSGEILVNISNTKLTTSSVGGIAGASDSNVNNCYNIGNINISDSPNSTSGGIVGGCQYITSDVADCYYLNTTKNGVGYGTDNATLCTNDQMKHSATFNGFNFDTIWKMGDSSYPYPVLIAVPYNSNQSDNPLPDPDVPGVNTTLRYGANRFAFGEDITGYVGDVIDSLVVYTSANENIASLDIKSSNTNIVEIGTIEIGVGDYITSENEHIATVPLKLKSAGTSTITITSPEGISKSVKVTVSKAPEVEKSMAVFTTEKSLSVNTGDSMWLAFGLMNEETGLVEDDWRKMAITVSDPTIISLSDYEETEYGYSLEVIGKKEGATNVTITDTETGINTIIVISVHDSFVQTYSYEIDNMNTFYPNNGFEDHIATNIYDLNGMYVNNYNAIKNTDGSHTVTFDVYNSRYYYGAVDIYDENGMWLGFEEIKKYSDIDSVWDTGVQTFYLISECASSIASLGKESNLLTYQQASFSIKTRIEISVPENGYFTISNNISESPGTYVVNSLEILFDAAFTVLEAATSGVNKVSAFDDILKQTKKTFAQRLIDARNESLKNEVKRKAQKVMLNSMQSKIKNITKKCAKEDIIDQISVMSTASSELAGLLESSLFAEYKINWKSIFESTFGLGEAFFTKFSGPAGMALQGCFAITKGTNKLLMVSQLAWSSNKPYVSIYSNVEEGYINPYGVVINTAGNIDSEAVLQVFRVSNDDAVDVILNSNNPLEKHELYNISFVKDDQLVQPSGKVTVHIPIPEGMNGNTCKVYRQETDGAWTILDAHIEGNYLVFETDHFSLYSVVGDMGTLNVHSLPNKVVYTDGDVLDITGLVLNLNGELISEGFICDPTVLSGIGNKKISVQYGNTSTDFNVEIREEIVLSSISVQNNPTKTTYYIGDSLSTSGLKLLATYSDGSTEIITSGFTTSGFSSTSAGTKTVTVSYEGFTDTFTVNVKTPSIVLSSNSKNMSVGDTSTITATTTPSGQTVTWTSSNTSIATVSGGTITTKASGSATITAKFTYNGVTYSNICSIVVNEVVVLESISVISNPTKTTYYVGDSLNTSGLKLLATYSDGSTKTITSGFTTSGFDSYQEGQQTITVSYGGRTTSFKVRVDADGIFTISFDANGGINAPISQTFEEDVYFTITEEIPTRENYRFVGWGSFATSTMVLCEPGDYVCFSGEDITLYAIWELNVVSGQCGDNAYFELTLDTGKLEISGTGSVWDYTMSNYRTRPWNDYADQIKSVIIKSGITRIGDLAFGLCNALESVVLSNTVESIGFATFENCSALDSVDLGGCLIIGKEAFCGCDALSTINLKNTTTIMEQAFYNCDSLNNVIIPESIEKIGDLAFGSCDELTKITVYAKDSSFGDEVFDYCDNIIIYGYIGSTVQSYADDNSIVFIPLEPNVVSIAITTFPSKTFYIGDALDADTIQIGVNYSDGTNNILTNGFTVTGLDSSSAGTKTVTVSYKGFTDTFTVSVKTPSITLLPRSKNMSVGDTSTITATTTPGGQTVTWTSSNTSVATVSSGTITAKASGSATITAKFTYNGITYTDTCAVTVNNPWCTISYDPNGGTGGPTYQTVLRNSSTTLSEESPVYEGYNFLGWSTSSTAKTPSWYAGSSITVTTDKFLYAVWEEIPEDTTSGQCGDNAYYSFDKTTGKLTISGIGDMDNWGSLEQKHPEPRPPWWEYRFDITSVEIESGITSVGTFAFAFLNNLSSIEIPDTVTYLGKYATHDCNIDYIIVPASVKHIGDVALHGKRNGDCTIYAYCNTYAESYADIVIHENKHTKPAQTATCTQTGYTAGTYCDDCDKYVSGHSVIKAKGHKYDNACDTSCNTCGATRTVTHDYDSGKVTKKATCEASGVKTYMCEDCGATKTSTIAKLTTHTYSNNCDKSCNVCGKTRTVGAHKYSNSCDTTCNYCNAKRTIKHTYSNSCDTSCNVCKATRTITHSYKTTTTKATLSKNGSIVKKCTVCGKVASNTAIKYAKTFKLSTTSYTYDGKVKAPSVTVKDSAGKALKKNTDYTVTYASGRKNVGTYKVTIKGKGNYSFTKTLTFKINPAKTTVSKLTAGSKSITVAITKKSTQVTGYQIQYSTSKSFSKTTTKTISSYKTTKYTLKSLSAKKTYYVRVRTYKTVGKTKYYSGWSTYKYVKTK